MLLEGRSKVCKSFSDECGNNHEHDDIIPVKIKYSDDAIDLLPWCEKIQDSRISVCHAHYFRVQQKKVLEWLLRSLIDTLTDRQTDWSDYKG